jgi:hypothetical protein
VTSRAFRTPGGMSIDTSFRQLVKRLPELRVTQVSSDYLDAHRLFYDDVARGLAFYVTVQDEVVPEFKPEALVVHPRGTAVGACVDRLEGKLSVY